MVHVTGGKIQRDLSLLRIDDQLLSHIKIYDFIDWHIF